MVGATWASGVVTNHYLITFAAALAVEPRFRESLRHARLLPATIRSWMAHPVQPARVARDPASNS